MKRFAAIVLMLVPLAARAADPEVAKVLDRFAKAKPDAKAMGFYSLDWEPTLAAAQARGKREGRPVLLIANTNITAGCNFYSGHT